MSVVHIPLYVVTVLVRVDCCSNTVHRPTEPLTRISIMMMTTMMARLDHINALPLQLAFFLASLQHVRPLKPMTDSPEIRTGTSTPCSSAEFCCHFSYQLQYIYSGSYTAAMCSMHLRMIGLACLHADCARNGHRLYDGTVFRQLDCLSSA